MVPGDDPYLEKEIGGNGRPSTSRSRDSSSKRGALAAGVAGAAIGAGIMHHHNRKQQDDEKTLVTDEPSQPTTEPQIAPVPQAKVARKPVPINTTTECDPSWPYSPVSPIDPAAESAALAKFPTRSSQESRRSFSRDAARANAAFDQEYAPQTDLLHEPESETSRGRGHGHGQALATAAAGLAVGGIGGAALARHHDNRRRSRSNSSSSAHRRSLSHLNHTESPHRLSGPFQSDEPTPLASTDSSSNNSYTYSDALATQPSHGHTAAIVEESALPQQVAAAAAAPPSQPQAYTQSDPYDVPPVPVTRSRRNSALGTAAPGAAAFSYINRPAIPSPLSSEIRHDSRSDSPPRMPSRSPRRRSRGVSSTPRRASQDSTPYDDVYASNPWLISNRNDDYQFHPQYKPQYTEPQDLHDGVPSDPNKAIVGDNGYPHMGIPRRKSGGEYDFESNGPLGPQTLAKSMPPKDGAATRTSTLDSDNSSWRLSSGMPGGWRRASGEYSRLSGEQSPRIPGRLRASEVAGGGSNRYYEGVGQAL